MTEQLDYLYMMTEICGNCPHSKNYRIGINCTYKSKKQFGIENCPIALKSRASKCFTNPVDALIAFRELIKRKEVESKNGIE